MPAPRPAVFLDRDGTLNEPLVRGGKPYPPGRVEEFRICDGAAEACARLKAAGFALVVVTNQPDVGRGTQSSLVVDTMHARLRHLIPALDWIEVCHAPGQGRPHPENHRRKPEPGMLLDAAAALGLDLRSSWMVGDRAGDIDAGHAAGCRTIFLDRGYAENPPARPPHFTVPTLAAAAGIILAEP
jgi:D-glycero-D-manno-heptose 1,7-bisphosphate phosphatase